MSLLYETESFNIRGAAFDVYKELGCGHKEVVYQRAYHEALTKRRLKAEREKQLPVYFNEKKVGIYTPDEIVEDKILVEIKAKPQITTQDVDQFWHYLTGCEYKLGFLINFGKPGGVEIIRRVYETARNTFPRPSAPDSASFRVAIVHDSFTQMGGAERVVDVLHEMFPSAPVFTLVFDPVFKEKYTGWDIRTSPLQTLYAAVGKLQFLLPWIPWAVDQLDFKDFNVVISSSSGFVKNIRVPKNTAHVCYCHTPPRFLWLDKEYVKQEVPFWLRPIVKYILSKMRKWDLVGSKRVTHFIANSKEVQKRIESVYQCTSNVVYPGVDLNFWRSTVNKSNYFLIAGRLQPHKNNELIINIFNELGLPLHVVGTGRQEQYLKSIAKPNITFLGAVADERLRDEYSGALAYIYPQTEDFGLMPLEAAACGTATLAYAYGGVLETVVPGVTGELFESYDKEKIKQIILNWKVEKYKTEELRKQAEKFSKEKFKQEIANFVQNLK